MDNLVLSANTTKKVRSYSYKIFINKLLKNSVFPKDYCKKQKIQMQHNYFQYDAYLNYEYEYEVLFIILKVVKCSKTL